MFPGPKRSNRGSLKQPISSHLPVPRWCAKRRATHLRGPSSGTAVILHVPPCLPPIRPPDLGPQLGTSANPGVPIPVPLRRRSARPGPDGPFRHPGGPGHVPGVRGGGFSSLRLRGTPPMTALRRPNLPASSRSTIGPAARRRQMKSAGLLGQAPGRGGGGNRHLAPYRSHEAFQDGGSSNLGRLGWPRNSWKTVFPSPQILVPSSSKPSTSKGKLLPPVFLRMPKRDRCHGPRRGGTPIRARSFVPYSGVWAAFSRAATWRRGRGFTLPEYTPKKKKKKKNKMYLRSYVPFPKIFGLRPTSFRRPCLRKAVIAVPHEPGSPKFPGKIRETLFFLSSFTRVNVARRVENRRVPPGKPLRPLRRRHKSPNPRPVRR